MSTFKIKIGGCFPTGQHYPGIADRISLSALDVKGLSALFEPTRAWLEIPLAVIDFETTGRDADNDRIIEIGVVGVDDGTISFREGLLIDPEMRIPEDAIKVHGITNEEVAGAPKFREILPHLRELLGGRIPVAYNAPFDRGFLLEELRRARKSDAKAEREIDIEGVPAFDEELAWIDPLVWARELLTELRQRTLSSVTEHLGIPLENAHRAVGDAEATAHVLLRLAPQLPEAYADLIRIQERHAAAHFRFRR